MWQKASPTATIPGHAGVAGPVHVHQPAHRHDVGDRPAVVGRGHDVERRDRSARGPPGRLVAQHAQLAVGRRGEEDHGERPVVAAEGVEAHVAEVAARVQDRRVEVLDALGKLEVAAVVDGAGIGRLAGRPRPAAAGSGSDRARRPRRRRGRARRRPRATPTARGAPSSLVSSPSTRTPARISTAGSAAAARRSAHSITGRRTQR